MKDSVWNILTAILLVVFVLVTALYVTIFVNPASAFNPFPPPADWRPTELVLPTATPTYRQLPATWTATPLRNADGSLKPTSTLIPTSTSFSIPTFTATFTVTPTPTITPSPTRTPTHTPVPPTKTPRPTQPPTETPSATIDYGYSPPGG